MGWAVVEEPGRHPLLQGRSDGTSRSCDLSPSSSRNSRECPTSFMGSPAKTLAPPLGQLTISVYPPRGPSPRIELRTPAVHPGCQPPQATFIHPCARHSAKCWGMAVHQPAQREKDASKTGLQRPAAAVGKDFRTSTHPGKPPFPKPSSLGGLTTHTAQEASLDTCFFSHRLLHPVWRLIKRWGEEAGYGARWGGGEHQAAWALMAVFIRGGFFFNPKVKAFLFETSIYIPESKKKTRQQSSRPISVPSRVTDTASELRRGNILSPLPELLR